MKVFELLPRPLGKIFRKLTHLPCNLPKTATFIQFSITYHEWGQAIRHTASLMVERHCDE